MELTGVVSQPARWCLRNICRPLITVTPAISSLRAKARILKFRGYYPRLCPKQGKGGEDEVDCRRQVKDVMALEKLDAQAAFTKAAGALFRKPALSKELEKRGIWPALYLTPRSFHDSRIADYVSQETNRRFYAEKRADYRYPERLG